MKVPHDKMSRVALMVVGLLFLSHTVYLISQMSFGTRWSSLQPSIASLLFTGLLSLVSLFPFFAWQKHFRYSLAAFFFFWLSFATKEVAGFLVSKERLTFEILVTAFRMLMCVSLAIGLLQGELSRLLIRQRRETNST